MYYDSLGNFFFSSLWIGSFSYQDIPLNKRLYVLEDIDCADLKDVVKDREVKVTKKTKGDGEEDNEEEEEKKEVEEEYEPESDSGPVGGLDLLSLLKVSTVDNFKNRNKVRR